MENRINKEKELVTLRELMSLLKQLPRLDYELEPFAKDLEDICNEQPLLPTTITNNPNNSV